MTGREEKSNITLYERDCIRSLAIRIMLREKGLSYRAVPMSTDSFTSEQLELNPLCELPMVCVRHDPLLFDALIIADYLDERYPEPSLYLPGPAVKASIKLMLHRFQHIFIPAAESISRGGKDAPAAKRKLLAALTEIAPVLDCQRYLLSDESVSVLDCFLCAMLWKLPEIGAESTQRALKPLRLYLSRMYSRPSFKLALAR